MEVHAHSHTQRKRWTHYFWEFMMLFLAVFAGFLAENQREHYVEHQREKELAHALYTEFFDDSVAIAIKMHMRFAKEKDMEYLNAYVKDSSLTSLPREFYPAYTTVMYLATSYSFEPKDGILSQLKSSGALRYFKNPELQKLLGDISVCINNVRYRNEQEYQFFASPIKQFILKHYDFNWFNELRKRDPNSYTADVINNYRISDTTIKAGILNLDSFDRSEVSNMILFYKQMLVSTRTLPMNDYIRTNKEILKELRKTYKLK